MTKVGSYPAFYRENDTDSACVPTPRRGWTGDYRV
jgi:hypothetical protein